MSRLLPIFALYLSATLVPTYAAIPPDSIVTDKAHLVDENGTLVATDKVTVKVAIPDGTSRILIEGLAGKGRLGFNANLEWNDESTPTMLIFRVNGEHGVDEQFMHLRGGHRVFFRPNLNFYATPARRQRVQEISKTFPSPATEPLKIEIRCSEGRAEVWLNDRFVDLIQDTSGFLTSIEFTLDVGAGIRNITFDQDAADRNRFLALNVEPYARPANWEEGMGEMGVPDPFKNAIVSIDPGARKVGDIPFQVTRPERSVNLSHMGWLACPSDDGTSMYWRRSSVDALPEACIISLPKDTYSAAHILCASDEEIEGRIPEFTVRLSRNAGGRGDAYADTRVKLPTDGNDTENAKKVGTVEYTSATGETKTATLWKVTVPLKSGMIQDILHEGETAWGHGTVLPTPHYLDLEIMEPLAGEDENAAFPPALDADTKRVFIPPGLRTNVHVFGVTMERTPADLVVRSNVPGHYFYEAEKPALQANVNIREQGTYTVGWKIADVDGKIVMDGTKEVTGNAKENKTVDIPLAVPYGWYNTQVVVRDAKGRQLLDNRSTFTMLPPDTRKAGRESPFNTWWFNYAHGGTKDYINVGRTMMRAGIRHTMLDSDSVMAESKVTTVCIPWRQPNIDNWVGQLEDFIRSRVEGTPETTTVMIHHETDSYDGRFPSELWGQEPKEQTEKARKAWETRMHYLIPGLRMIREKFPHLKIQIGNTGNSCEIVAEMFRMGLPKDLVDYVAVEDLGQAVMPERPVLGSLQSAWFLRQTARHFGYDNVQVTACYEWINRMHTRIGLKLQAEFYVRDALHALAYGFHTIGQGSIHDAGQGYFHSIWGAGGLTYRYPYMYPKPSYAATATLTRQVDGAKVVQFFPTGSTALYALEFQRGDEWLYALWTPRGNRELAMNFTGDGEKTLTDLYGRESKQAGRTLNLTASTGARYIASPQRLESIVAGKSTFPDDPAQPENIHPIDLLENAGDWNPDPGINQQRLHGQNFPHRRAGNFELHTVKDEEKGDCIEIVMLPQETEMTWPALHDQVFLKPGGGPIVNDAGPYKHVGLWVKGNASWGDININIVNAEGKRTTLYPNFRGPGTINHDGWAYHEFNIHPGADWEGDINIESIFLTNSTKVLYGTDFTDVKETRIRIKNLFIY